MKVHVFASDVTPGRKRGSSGGGLRSSQIIEGLRRKGFQVTYSLPGGTPLFERYAAAITKEEKRFAYSPVYWRESPYADQAETLDAIQPDVAIWCNLNTYALPPLHRLECVKVCDLHGPVTIEQVHLTHAPMEEVTHTSIQRLREFDAVLVPSPWQRFFWAPLALAAGLETERILIVPVAFDVNGSVHTSAGEPIFCTAGNFLPWQDPFGALQCVARVLEEAGEGELRVMGAPHDIPGKEHAKRELERLAKQKRVTLLGMLEQERVDAEVARASFAIELMGKNLERELAFSTRHSYYVSRGLPIVTSNYSYFDQLVREHDCGYCIDPNDHAELQRVIREILKGRREIVARKSRNALSLASTVLDPARAIEPLVAICQRPEVRRSRLSPTRRSTNGKPRLRVLGVTADPWALRQLRLVEPLLSLRMKGLIDGFTIVGPRDGTTQVCGPEVYDAYDVMVVQREVAAYPIGRALIELFGEFVLDVDDHMFARPAHRNGVGLTAPEFADALRAANSVTVSTKRLCALLEKSTGIELRSRAHLVPNGIRFPEGGRSEAEPPRGMIWTSSDFAALTESRELILRALNEVSRKHSLTIHCVGMFSDDLRRRLLHGQYLGRMSFWEHKSLLASSAPLIALCPLETKGDRETLDFIAGKSDLKMVEYGGYGHPGVYSKAPPYVDTELSVGQLVGNGYSEWHDALEHTLREGYKSSISEMQEVRRTRHMDVIAEEYWFEGISAGVAREPVGRSAIEATVQALACGNSRRLAYD